MPETTLTRTSAREREAPGVLPPLVVGSGQPTARLVSVAEAAERYGCSWRTLLRWADAGLVPKGFKLGGRRLFKLDELLDHINRGCPKVS